MGESADRRCRDFNSVRRPRHRGGAGDGGRTLNIAHDLKTETHAARSLLLSIRDVVDGDEEATSDAIEGETDLFEAIHAALMRLAELDAYAEGIKIHMSTMKARAERFDAQADKIRAAITHAMETVGVKKIERDIATVSLRSSPPKVVVTSEADIPSSYWKEPPPVIDKKAILDALKAKQAVPGAQLSNQSTTVQIRWK